MANLAMSCFASWIWLLGLQALLVCGGDTSQQHPIKVLDLNCYCKGLGTGFCTQKAPSGLPRTVYYNWLYDSCRDIPGWTGLPSTNDLKLPDSVTILSTELSAKTPSCVATQDAEAFQACYLPTSDVTSWVSNVKVGPQSYQLDQSCFCKSSAFTDIVTKRSTCAVQSIGYAQALVWMSMYCGTYNNFESQQMPPDWRTLIPVYDTTLHARKSDFHCTPTPNGPSQICQFALDSIDSSCNGSMRCTSTTDCNNPIAAVNRTCFPIYDNAVHLNSDRLRNAWVADSASTMCGPDFQSLMSQCDTGTRSVSTTSFTDLVATVNKNCFCSKLNSYDRPDLSWCGGDHLGILKSMQWFEKECGNSSSQVPAGLLVPWKERVSPASFTINPATNLVAGENSKCPSSRAKLGTFAVNNVVMAILVPLIGRRTLINKVTCGLLGRAHSMIWPITGVIGVALHLGSNAVNAKIIQSTPGYEHISIGHLILLWCTRPRLAWLVVALVPLQSSKAMYFSVTASVLFTECVLQLIGAVAMGIATNYGRKASFYTSNLLNGQADAAGHYARIMYAGGLLDLVAFPFAIAACAWTVFGISRHIRSLSSYLLGMQAAARKVGRLADKHRAELNGRLNSEFVYLVDDEIVGVAEHYHYVRSQLGELGAKWLAIHASAMPISKELRSERRQRAHETRTSTYNRGAAFRQEDPETAWFADPVRRADESRIESHNAIQVATAIEDHRATLIIEMEQNRNEATRLRRREKQLRQKLEELNAMNDLSTSSTSRYLRFLSAPWNSNPHTQSPEGLGHAAAQNPALVQKYSTVQRGLVLLDHTHNQQVALIYAYDDLVKSCVALKDAWRLLAQCWQKVSAERLAELEKTQQVKGSLIAIPVVVLVGMTATWIAQWLWWSGYVYVARDTYCPPNSKLAPLTIVWTFFSALGAIIGASF